MRFKILLSLLIIVTIHVTSFAWIFDNGLEKTVVKYRQLFQKKELSQIYFCFVDPVLRIEVNQTINKMKKDKKWGRIIAKRLNFKNYREYIKAENDEIIRHFFYKMLYSKDKRRSKIKNQEYLQLSLALTLLVAPFDKNMRIIDYDMYDNGACVIFKQEKVEINAYFINKRDVWYLTSKKLSEK